MPFPCPNSTDLRQTKTLPEHARSLTPPARGIPRPPPSDFACDVRPVLLARSRSRWCPYRMEQTCGSRHRFRFKRAYCSLCLSRASRQRRGAKIPAANVSCRRLFAAIDARKSTMAFASTLLDASRRFLVPSLDTPAASQLVPWSGAVATPISPLLQLDGNIVNGPLLGL